MQLDKISSQVDAGCTRADDGKCAKDAFWTPWLLLIFSVPFVALVWHVNNGAWPADDAANYLTSAYQQYLRIKSGDIWTGLVGLYEIRGWRPILFPVLAVPFLWLFNGNVIAAVGGVLVCSCLGWQVYFFAIARRYLPSIQAVVAVIIVGSLPAFVSFSTVFFSELTWLFFVSGWVFHCLSCNDFSNSRHATLAGVFLGLAILVRPAETVLISIIPVTFFVARAWRRQLVGRREILIVASLLVSLGAMLGVSAFVAAIDRRIILLPFGLAAIGLAIFSARRILNQKTTGLTWFIVVLCTINLLWWAGWMRALYAWVYPTSFGEMAAVMETRVQTEGIGSVLAHITQMYVESQFLLIALAVPFALPAWRQVWIKGNSTRLAELGIVASGMLLPTFVIYGLTQTSDHRRAFVGMAFVILFIVVFALGPGLFRRLRIVALGSLAVLQVLGIASAAHGGTSMARIFGSWANISISNPHSGVDQNVETIDHMLSLGVAPGSTVAVYTLSLFHAADRVYEPAALQLASVTLGEPIHIMYFWDIGEYDAVLDRLAMTGVRYLLLDSFDYSDQDQRTLPYVRFTSDLLRRMSVGGSSLPRLRLVGQFDLGQRRHWLFEIHGREVPRLIGNIPETFIETAGASTEQIGYPAFHLIDGTFGAWGSNEARTDVFAYLVLKQPTMISGMRIYTFSPGGRAHLRDIRVFATDEVPSKIDGWCLVPLRLHAGDPFSDRISLPALPDRTSVDIELNQHFKCYGPHKIWGIACLRQTKGDQCNHLTVGNGMYIREIQVR